MNWADRKVEEIRARFASENCLVCGNTHSGKCSPDSFVYFQCSECKRGQQMPYDACFGFDNVYCCSDEKPASELWEKITYERYKEIGKNDGK